MVAREGLKWSDGTALTANDYVYSALRVLTPETTSQYVNMISDFKRYVFRIPVVFIFLQYHAFAHVHLGNLR